MAKFRWRWRYALFAGAVLVAVLAAWLLWLDRQVVSQFQGRRWTQPAQVYAEPLELYVGLPFTADVLEQELRRLRYRASDRLEAPGTYRRSGSRIDLAARRAQFWDETRDAQLIRIAAPAGGIASLTDARGQDVPIFRLDPMLIGSIFPSHGEDRVVITPDEVPPLLPAALKVVEDRAFDRHFGVNPLAILRAIFANLRAGQIEQGGSTLTQQLVRSYFLDTRQTWSRKIKEALMSISLEAHFDKRDLMTAYINEIFLGQDGRRAIHGFGLASRFYFGKSLGELDLAQLATLVAVVRGPSYYDPRRHPERVLARRNLVLKLMAQFDVVSDADARAAMARPLGVTGSGEFDGGYYPAFLDLVRRTLRRDYREEDLTGAGLRIYATLDPRVQARAERTLVEELAKLDQAKKRPVPGKPAPAPLEGVVVVTSPQSGDVIALVGGRRTNFDGFNRALDAKRSIGSLAKPVVYLTALETGRYTAASIVLDEPVDVKLANGQRWRPQNFAHDINGPVPLVRALAMSLNLATVHLGLEVGLAPIAKNFAALGLPAEPAPVPAMLLGAVDAAPIDVAQVFNTLANGGFRTPLRAVRAVLDEQGKPLKAFGIETTQVAPPEAVSQLNRMLLQTVERGSGAAARAVLPAGLAVAGKTGTSSDYRDSWFAGFSGAHLAVVWVGRDDNEPTGLTGATGALAIWSRVMAGIHTTSFVPVLTEDLEEVWVDWITGEAADPECSPAVVAIAVPRTVTLPVKQGCGQVRGPTVAVQ